MINNKIKLFSIVDSLISDLGEEYRNQVPWLMKHAEQAAKAIISYNSFTDRLSVREVTENRFVEIPKFAAYILAISPGEKDENSLTDFYEKNITESLLFPAELRPSDSINGEMLIRNIPWRIENGHISFERELLYESVTIHYLEYEVDTMGFIMINEAFYEYIKDYLTWKLIKKENFKNFMKKTLYRSDIMFEDKTKRSAYINKLKAEIAVNDHMSKDRSYVTYAQTIFDDLQLTQFVTLWK